MLCDTLRPMAHHFVNGGGSKNSTIDQYKLNQVRTYYPDGKRKRAACLCFRNEARDEVLLVSSRSSPGYWVIPGGGLEPNETPAVAAERELEEEAGVSSRLVEFLGNFEDASSKHRTSVYASVVTHEFDSWEDQERIGRRRRWFSVEEASRRLMEYKPYQDQYLQVAIATRCKMMNFLSVADVNSSMPRSLCSTFVVLVREARERMAQDRGTVRILSDWRNAVQSFVTSEQWSTCAVGLWEKNGALLDMSCVREHEKVMSCRNHLIQACNVFGCARGAVVICSGSVRPPWKEEDHPRIPRSIRSEQ